MSCGGISLLGFLLFICAIAFILIPLEIRRHKKEIPPTHIENAIYDSLIIETNTLCRGIIFTSPDTGYIYGTSYSHKNIMHIQSTYDGGRTWNKENIFGDGNITEMTSWQDIVYIIRKGTEIWKTDDAGKSWVLLKNFISPIASLQIFTPDTMTLIQRAGVYKSDSTRKDYCYYNLMITYNGGKSWQPHVSSIDRIEAQFRCNNTLYHGYNDIRCWNIQTNTQKSVAGSNWQDGIFIGDENILSNGKKFFEIKSDSLIYLTSYPWGHGKGSHYGCMYISKHNNQVFAANYQYMGPKAILYSNDGGYQWQVAKYDKLQWKWIYAHKGSDNFKLFYLTPIDKDTFLTNTRKYLLKTISVPTPKTSIKCL